MELAAGVGDVEEIEEVEVSLLDMDMEQQVQRARQLRRDVLEATRLKHAVNTMQIEIDKLAEKELALKSELETARVEKENLKKDIDDLQNAIFESEKVNKGITDSMVLKAKDSARMNKAKEMLDLGKMLTGIRWNYSAAEDVTSGYIANKTKGILKPFEYRTNDKAVETHLWNDIEANNSVDWSDLEGLHIDDVKYNKENKPSNK